MAEAEVVQATSPTIERTEAPAPTWRDSLPDDLKADQTLASIKGTSWNEAGPILAKMTVEAQKKIGARVEAGIKIPDASSTPEEKAAYRKALGVPDTPEQYQIKPHAMMNHSEWNKEAQAGFLKLFHEEAIPPQAAERIIHAYADFIGAQVKANDTMAAEARAELRTEWGANHDAYMGAANTGIARVAKELGVEKGDLIEATKGSDPALVAKMFHWMESQFTEHGWVSGEPVVGMSREEAETKIGQLQEQLLKLDPNSDRASDLVNEIVKYRRAAMQAA